MVAKLTRGHTYSPGSDVNAANLMDLLANATMAGMDRSNIDRTTANCVTRVDDVSQAEELEPVADQQTRWILSRRDVSSALVPVPSIPTGISFVLVDVSPAVKAGELLFPVTIDGADLILRKATATAGVTHKTFGVSATDVEPDGRGVAILSGVCRVLTDGEGFQVGDSVYRSLVQAGRAASNVGEAGVTNGGAGKIGICIAVDGNSIWVSMY